MWLVGWGGVIGGSGGGLFHSLYLKSLLPTEAIVIIKAPVWGWWAVDGGV